MRRPQYHSGSLGGGHYTAFGKNSNGNWYNFNDDIVRAADPSQWRTPGAYVLFYAQQDLEVRVGAVCWVASPFVVSMAARGCEPTRA